MPLESGGRADKDGNKYEYKVVANQILDLIEEKIEYIIFEPIGVDGYGVDICIGHKDGTRNYQQCKSRNSSKEYWDFSSAKSNKIFKNWKDHLSRDKHNYCSLISPLTFTIFEDLIKRAKNSNDNPQDFYNFQILPSSIDFIKTYNNFCEEMELSTESFDDVAVSIDYLKRIEFTQIPDNSLSFLIKAKINYMFTGDPNLVYSNFISYIIEENVFGIKITISKIYEYIFKMGVKFKNLSNDDRIYPRILKLNEEYRNEFTSLNNGFIERKVFLKCNEYISENKSLIIHGKAGRGKSGCTESIINHCEYNRISYIAIKLDKRIPHGNADIWGNELGLPASIVQCLHSISKEESAVLILDQLDALRWTQSHSNDSLIVCSEIIDQVKQINVERLFKISIIFVCRTFDLENDLKIKKLIYDDERNSNNIDWEIIEIEELDDEEVYKIIGPKYNEMSHKMKQIFRTPSNLYIWQQLDKNENYIECTSAIHLIQTWWQQLVSTYSLSRNGSLILDTKKQLIDLFNKNGKSYILLIQLSTNGDVLDYLKSSGFLIIKNEKVYFTHQSILDYFVAERMINQYLDGISFIEILGDVELQTPLKRYQLQMLMEYLSEYEIKTFIKAGKELLFSDSIRFYNKYVFLEVLNQKKEIDFEIKNIIIELCRDKYWRNHVIDNVIYSKAQYYRLLSDSGLIEEWVNDTEMIDIVIRLLISISPNYVSEDLDLIIECSSKSFEKASLLNRCFSRDIYEDTDQMFELRLLFYKRYPELSDSYINFKAMMKKCEIRTIRYFSFLLENRIKNKEKSIYGYENDLLLEDSDFLVENGEQIIKLLIPFIPKKRLERIIDRDWFGDFEKKSLERVCVNILKKANISVIKENPSAFFNYYRDFFGLGFDIYNELILNAFITFPTEFSNEIIEYLLLDFDNRIFDKTSNNVSSIDTFKYILRNHSEMCDKSVFEKLEKSIYFYIPPDAKENLRNRIEYKHKFNVQILEWSYWGDLQFELLSVLPEYRLSKKSLDLKKVLIRKYKNSNSKYLINKGHSGGVSSPVSNKKISLKNWLDIINNRKISNRENRKWKEVKGGFIESTIEEFSRSFSNEVIKEPLIMLEFILEIESNINDLYIDALYNGLIQSVQINEIQPLLIEQLFHKFPYDNYSNRGRLICLLIQKLEFCNWSDKTHEIVRNIAMNHEDPSVDNVKITNENDRSMNTYEMLISNAINCVRGEAAEAIGHILWKDRNCFKIYKDAIEKLAKHGNDAVKLSSLFSLFPSLKIDFNWSSTIILKLFEDDIRLIGYHYSRYILFEFYESYRERVLEIIQKSFYSNDEAVIKNGAFSIVEAYFQKGEFTNILFDIEKMSQVQSENILYMAIEYFNISQFNERAKEIILKFKQSKFDLEFPISRLFHDNIIDLQRDKEFLLELMTSKLSNKILYTFTHYLEVQAINLFDFWEVIIPMCHYLIENLSEAKKFDWYIDENLIKLIIGLYDEIHNSEINDKRIENECLYLWDKMFEKNIGSIKALSTELMNR